MPLIGDFKPVPLPEKFTVGIYYSDTNPMHNIELLIDIAAAMPDIEFKFFGGSRCSREGNIEYIPWKNIHDIIKQCSINVRFTVHDGFPHVPIQFLLSGRQVITNSNMPYMHHFDYKLNKDNYADCKVKLIAKIREVKKNIGDKDNIEKGSVYYKNITDPEGYKKIIYNILEKGKSFMFEDDILTEKINA